MRNSLQDRRQNRWRFHLRWASSDSGAILYFFEVELVDFFFDFGLAVTLLQEHYDWHEAQSCPAR